MWVECKGHTWKINNVKKEKITKSTILLWREGYRYLIYEIFGEGGGGGEGLSKEEGLVFTALLCHCCVGIPFVFVEEEYMT
jgi:hypothetical protein